MNIIINKMNYVQTLVKSTVIGLLARAGLAATFFLSGQSKVEGLQIDILGGSHIELGFPHVTTNAIDLFRDEYRLPLLSPELAATLSASAEHLFPILLILGLATRFSALALMIMTLVIQLLVYPDAWPVHAIWLAAQLHLMSYGAGQLSLDHLIFRRR